MCEHFIGIDLGGTNIATAVVDAAGRVVAQHSQPTEASRGPTGVMDNIADAARTLMQQAGMAKGDLAGVGIGVPGLIDAQRGIVKDATNLPGFQGIAVCDELSRRLDLPVALDNDANAAALGEYWAGAAKHADIQNMVMITLGTGVGGGAVVDGRVLRGSHGMGLEVGHMIIHPSGERFERNSPGALETYASANAIARRARHALDAGESSVLAEQHGTAQPLTARHVFEAAADGDALARRIVKEAAEALGIACVTLTRVFDPQAIVFAGGMVRAGDTLFKAIRLAYARYDWKLLPPEVQILPAQLADDAGVIGAASLAWQAFER